LALGQVVTTSSIDPNIPENLLLGEIIEIKKTDQDIFQQAILKPYFDIKELKYVLVQINEQ
ncbi:hypothetical protein KJ855_01255, partial [Patescibacteria group bacterium]|nr:hypothetical protein [Patescibacteria group bacterium]